MSHHLKGSLCNNFLRTDYGETTIAVNTISVVIADDHEIVRDAVRGLLSEVSDPLTTTYRVDAEATNGLEAITAVKHHTPDLLFLDLSMPLAGGFEIISDVRRWSSNTKIVVFTGVTAPGLLANAIEAGVDAIFPKTTSPAQMGQKLELVIRGARFIHPDLVETIKQGQQIQRLTKRERETLNLILVGKTTREIAEQLNLSPKTIDKHRVSLMKKLDVHSVAELMVRALKDGLIDPT